MLQKKKLSAPKYVSTVMFAMDDKARNYLASAPLECLTALTDPELVKHPIYFRYLLVRLRYVKQAASNFEEHSKLDVNSSIALGIVKSWFKSFKDTGVCHTTKLEYEVIQSVLEYAKDYDLNLNRIAIKRYYESIIKELEREPMFRNLDA